MAMTEQDREWIKSMIQTASVETIKVAREDAKAVICETLKMHISACPHGQQINVSRAFLAGISLAMFVGGGSAGAFIVKALMGT